MTTFTYILSYNPTAANFSLNQLNAFVQSNRNIESWYLAFSGTYVIKASASLASLLPAFSQFFDGSHFILSYVTPALMTGLLPPNAWHWLNTNKVVSIGSD